MTLVVPVVVLAVMKLDDIGSDSGGGEKGRGRRKKKKKERDAS